jgi:rhodanese-related sulfurtransferase
MNTITKEELKSKLEGGKNFRLLMCMSEEAYTLKHIPGSVCFDINGNPQCNFSADEEIIVYCSGEECRFSTNAYNFLTERGYKRVYHYAGGLADWEKNNYPLEGNLANNGFN